MTRRTQVRERTKATRRLLQALAASTAYIRSIGTDGEARERVSQAVAERLRTPPEHVLLHLDRFHQQLPHDLRVDMEAARVLQGDMVAFQPTVQQVRLDELLDASILDGLEREGFFQTLTQR